MKKFMMLLCALCALLSPLWCTSSFSTSEREELSEIIAELKDLNEEQNQIMIDSQKRNEELEKQSSEQEKQLQELENLSQSKQQIIDEQQTIIDELKSLSKEQKKSSIKTWINLALAVIVSFLGGFIIGRL